MRFENETKLKIKIIHRTHGEQKQRFWMLGESRYRRKRNCLRVAHGPWSEVQVALFWKEMTFRHRNSYSSATNTVLIISWREIITDTDWLAAWNLSRPFSLNVKRLLMFLTPQQNSTKTTKLEQHLFYTIGWTYKKKSWVRISHPLTKMTTWKSINLWLATFLRLHIALMYPATQEWSCTLRSSALTQIVQTGKEHVPH